MESQPQYPEFRINPVNFHSCIKDFLAIFLHGNLFSLVKSCDVCASSYFCLTGRC